MSIRPATLLMVLWVLFLGAPAPASAAETGDGSPAGSSGTVELHAESVYALFDLIDTLRLKNPGYVKQRVELATLEPDARRERLDELVAVNAADPDIVAAMDRFLETEARLVYFRRFRNATPEHFRRAFLALPYEKIQAPGDLALPFYQLIDTVKDVRESVDRFLGSVDLKAAEALARGWAPSNQTPLPPVYLVYDLNAGSYTAEGKAFYNLYFGEGTDALSGDQNVLAHELQHLIAAPFLRMARRYHAAWESARMEEVLMDLVSEGAALHCNPPKGLKGRIFEDPETVAALVEDLNRHFLRLLDGQVEESEHWDWVRASQHGRARELLEAFAAKEASDPVAAAELVNENLSRRPDLPHALGWWMVSRISKEGKEPQRVHDLIQNPYSLFARYNEAAPQGAALVDQRIVAALAAERP